MLQAERLQMILNKAQRQNLTIVEELAQMLHVNLMTIRRDLSILCEQHLLKQRHGGVKISRDTIMEINYNVKKEYQREEKQKIAQKAAELVGKNDTIYLDSGMTIGEIARLFREDSKHPSVVINELSTATILMDPDVDLTILGGTVRKKTKNVIDHTGEKFLKQFRFSKAFLGMPSVNYNFEVFSPALDRVYLKQTAMGLISQACLVADSSRSYSQAMCLVDCLSEFTGVMTDKKSNEKEWEKIRELNISVIGV